MNIDRTWILGVLDQTGGVVSEPRHRGGRECLVLETGGAAEWRGRLMCGDGFKRRGSWTFDSSAGQLRLAFDERVAYRGSDRGVPLKEVEHFRVVVLTELELVLERSSGEAVDDAPQRLAFLAQNTDSAESS